MFILFYLLRDIITYLNKILNKLVQVIDINTFIKKIFIKQSDTNTFKQTKIINI